MRHKVRFHYDNEEKFKTPLLKLWRKGTGRLELEVPPSGEDDFGYYYDIGINRRRFNFAFGDKETEKEEKHERFYTSQFGEEIWCKTRFHNVYNVKPAETAGDIREVYQEIKGLIQEDNFYLPQTDVSEFKVNSLLGAHKLKDNSISFAFFHPRAARVYLGSNINDFQTPGRCPACKGDGEEEFIEFNLYRGYYNQPNIWWVRVLADKVNQTAEPIEYKFYVQGGIKGGERWVYDPYTRVYSFEQNKINCKVVDPTEFDWTDDEWETPKISDLIIYELNVYGFTDGDSDIPLEEQSTFKGVTRRIKEGYFNELGVTALALMPTSEAWSSFGLGYDPCSFLSVEQDFGTPDEFRELVNAAHEQGLAVIIDQVFNHTSNQFNPLWGIIDDGSDPGGFYFSGTTQWGNKLATGVDEVDNMLIDSCKLFIEEYHVDGFRFDATHTNFIDHKLMYEIHEEIKGSFKEDIILIAENLPNQSDLNFNGYDGYAQWSDMFHDKLKALLREGVYRDWCDDSPEGLGDIFYFCKNQFAAHTNNVVNYSESHDEPSIKYEVETNDILDCDIKERKARLGLLSCLTALGQPMIYMGQEFGINRDANVIDVNTATPDPNCPDHRANSFYIWAKGIINLRKEYDVLKISGYNPIEEGKFKWLIGPWLSEKQGKGKRVIGWRSRIEIAEEEMMVLINFEGREEKVDLKFTSSKDWIKLADINRVYKGGEERLAVKKKKVSNFTLPPYSGFIYTRN